MPDIYRPEVRVGSCITLEEMSTALGGSSAMLARHKHRKTDGFPRPAARFGPVTLYVEAELDAFYKAIQWKQTHRSVKELTGELSWDN